ncbi:MAG TPA: nitrile hydratase accessory protein [Ramlibacter sp.]|uniref:nitrile hydratase accessory protein n=1 Tax=Ramlibacter sp. TaxID=1917967 RepID=UPI002D80E68B|nr:nitrile hydratase accessory protein [Ramlibacter sp.]HET8744497.1 nitrile hydratase accessory protein [Ramlibacter sp.]
MSLSTLPGLPRDDSGPVFRAPWQAQAFAMTLALYERGLFSWTEWAQALAVRIQAAPAQAGEDAADAYYRQWLEALEQIVADKGASSLAELQRYQEAWDHAADRTPHGRPIELQPGDFKGD